MKKILVSLIGSLLFGILFSKLLIEISFIETVFTVSGIFFSVGMSVLVTMSTQDVRNIEAKNLVYKKNNQLLTNYIFSFLFQTALFVALMLLKKKDAVIVENIHIYKVSLNMSLFFMCYSVICICYYIFNMLETRKQIVKIETLIEQERSHK